MSTSEDISQLQNTRPLRRHKYLDFRLQGRMIISMVVSQAMLLIIAISVFYQKASDIFDEAIYSIHAPDMLLIFDQLIGLAAQITVAYILVTLMSFLIAQYLWSRYISHVLTDFEHQVAASHQLDFRPVLDKEQSLHPANITVSNWRCFEANKWCEVKKQFQFLIEQSENNELHRVNEIIQTMQVVLENTDKKE